MKVLTHRHNKQHATLPTNVDKERPYQQERSTVKERYQQRHANELETNQDLQMTVDYRVKRLHSNKDYLHSHITVRV